MLLLERILLNLTRNAVQACSAGSTVVLYGERGDSGLVFSVADNGPGVPAELEDRIFEPYVSSRRSGSQGAGLGLPICRLAAEALGGWIEYERRDPGAEFVLFVPISEEHETSPAGT